MNVRDEATGLFIRNQGNVGRRFGRVVITENLGCPDGKNSKVRCLCDCGRSFDTWMSGLYAASRADLSYACGKGACHNSWRGGKIVSQGGYIRMYAPGHPRASKNHVFEHILVMEAEIGRYLLPGETVHHKNGVRADNAPSNLELWDTNHCAGQRHVEKMAFHTQELVCKSSDEELKIVARAVLKRMRERGIVVEFAD